MNWNQLIRKAHRVVSVIFTLCVIANMAVQQNEEVALWVGMATLIPLMLLLITGLYLFVLPYVARRRGRLQTD